MQVDIPRPQMAAYMTIQLQPQIHPVKRIPILSGDGPAVAVNTVEILNLIHNPGFFILAWQEIHYSFEYDSNGTPRIKDEIKTFTHLENQGRVNRLREAWKEAQTGNSLQPVEIPAPISFEQELFNLGWVFQYSPGVGPVFPPEWEEKLNPVFLVDPINSPHIPNPHPAGINVVRNLTPPDTTLKTEGPDEVKLMLASLAKGQDHLIQAIGNLTAVIARGQETLRVDNVDAKCNPVEGDQLRPSGATPGPDLGPVDESQTPPTGYGP